MSDSDPSQSATFTVRSEPFMHDPPFAPAFYEALGRMVILWGRFETHLDSDLLIALNVARRFGIDHEMQLSLKRKTAMLRKVYSAVPVLTPLSSAMDALTLDIEDTSKDRNLLIHSSVGEWLTTDPPAMRFQNVTHNSGQIVFRRLDVRLDQISQITKTIDSLNTRLLVLTWSLTGHQLGTDGTAQLPAPSASAPTTPNPE